MLGRLQLEACLFDSGRAYFVVECMPPNASFVLVLCAAGSG